MKRRTKAFILLHLIVFIWGFTGILGKEISLPAIPLVWWRMLIAFMGIAAFAYFSKRSISATRKEIAQYAGVGVLTGAHWICFFASIKVSTISTALVVLSTVSFFVALVAPFIRRKKIFPYELLLGIMVFMGVFIIFKFESKYTTGIILSLLAAFLAALFSSFNSVLVQRHNPVKMAFYEMLGGFAAVTIFLFVTGDMNRGLFTVSQIDIIYLIVLGLLATAFAFIAGIEVMKELSPYTCALALNLEPLYTIVFALLIYQEGEYMSGPFYIGAAIILSTLIIEMIIIRLECKTE